MDIHSVLNAIADWPAGVVYPALFVMAVVENLFPPFPGDTVALFSGYLAGTGRLSLPGAFLAASVGAWVGFALLFALARVLGRDWVNRHIRPRVSPDTWSAAESRLTRYGLWMVLVNRFLAGLRSIIALVCGVMDLPAPPVLALAAVSSLLWNVLLLGGGFLVGEDWERLSRWLAAYNLLFLLVLASLGLLGLIVWLGYKNRRSGE